MVFRPLFAMQKGAETFPDNEVLISKNTEITKLGRQGSFFWSGV